MQTQKLYRLNEVLPAFLEAMSLNLSKSTLSAYKGDIRVFIEWLEGKGVKKCVTVKEAHICAYLSHCKQSGKSSATVHRYYMSIRAMFRYLCKAKYIEDNPLRDINPPLCRNKVPTIPKLDDMLRILDAPDTETERGVRDRAMLELLYSSGLRASELCSLSINDIHSSSVHVSNGKRGNTRTVPLTESARHWIQEYILRYRGTEDGGLFVTAWGTPIGRIALHTIVKYYARQCGIEGISTHTLRHACATHLLDHGADIRLIQEVLGHASILTTQRYTHLSSGRMQAMFNQFHPRDKS